MTRSAAVRHPDTNILEAGDGAEARPVYLDCCATTPLVEVALAEIEHFFRLEYGNGGSRTHEYGTVARKRINQARAEVAALVQAKTDEVIFTSGATEANNIAILGLEKHLTESGRRHIITSQIEHKAVLEPIERLEQRGFRVTRLAPAHDGRVAAESIARALEADTGMVSVMHVNNETGVVQPVDEIGHVLPDGVLFHVDAAQGLGKEFERIASQRIDLISGSAHKIHGPKGVGVLFTRRRKFKRPPLEPLTVGGGQERGLRPGTIPVPLVAGFGSAASAAVSERDERTRRNQAFRDRAIRALAPLNPEFHGDPEQALPQVLNIALPGVDGEAAVLATKDLIAFSNGSACTSREYKTSHVLEAMDLGEASIAGALRLSWCHLTPEPNWNAVVERLSGLQS